MTADNPGLESDVNRLYRLIGSSPNLEVWEKEQMLALLKRATPYDPLTGVFNSTFLDTRLNEEVSRAKRHNHLLSVMKIDIDDFGLYSVTFGSEQSSEALIHLAKILDSKTRAEYIVGRYGNEEFAIILPETDDISAICAGRDIISEVKSANSSKYVGIKEADNKKYSGQKGFQNLTVSIGVTTYPSITASEELLIRHADQALHTAKKLGGDRIELYNPTIKT